jgi:hypothetical protein
MPYESLPASARIENGVLYLPIAADAMNGQRVQVRLRAVNGAEPSPPVVLTLPVPTDEGTGVSLNNITAAEPLSYFTAVAIVDSLAYRFNPANRDHAYAFSGFSVAETPVGGLCQLKSLGVMIVPVGMRLKADQRYLASSQGGLALVPAAGDVFSRVIGFALNKKELRIVNLPPVFFA